jgi:hypothetical protein
MIRFFATFVVAATLLTSVGFGGPPPRAPAPTSAVTRTVASETAASASRVHPNSNASPLAQTQYGLFRVDTQKQVLPTVHKTGVSSTINQPVSTLGKERASFVSGTMYSPRAVSQLPALNNNTKLTENGRFNYVARNLRTIEEQPNARAIIKQSEQNTVTLATAKNGGVTPPGNQLPKANPASYWSPNPSRIKPAK